MRRSQVVWWVVGIVVVVLAAVWLNQSGPKATTPDTVKIGIMTMQTGPLGFLGQNVVRSAELAWEEMEDNYDFDVEFIVEDIGDLTDQGKAVSAFRKLVDIDGVEYIIDGMTSNSTMAIAPLIDEAKVTVVTPLTGGSNVDNAAEYLFRNGPSDVVAGTKPAEQLIDEFGYNRVAVLTDNAEYTVDILSHFVSSFEGTIVVNEVINPTGRDYRTELAKVKDSVAEVLVVNTADGVSAHTIIKQAGELGIEIPIFANFIAFGPDLFEVAGDAAEGVYIYDPEFNEDDPAVEAFLEKYEAAYGQPSPIAFHTTGTYDAVKMGLEAIEAAGYDGEAIHDYLLRNIKNWQGFNGTVTFDEKGNTETGFVLKQIRSGELVFWEG